MSYILFFIILGLVIASMLKVHKIKSPKTLISEAEKAYRELMEEISKCDSLSTLISCQSKIDHFTNTHSWKSIDGCEMVDKLNDKYNEIYDIIVYEQYSF